MPVVQSQTVESTTNQQEVNSSTQKVDLTLEQLVYKFLKGFVHRRLEEKYSMVWKRGEPGPTKNKVLMDNPKEYNEKKADIIDKTFLDVRSLRVGKRFIEYFASNIAPYQTEAGFSAFSKYLREHPEDVRNLTLLALSSLKPRHHSTDNN